MKAELARRIKTKEEAKAFLNACQGANFAIEDITTRPIKKNAARTVHYVYIATGSRT